MSVINTEPTVFLVDDDPSVRISLSRALRNRGLKVDVFDSAKAFLDNYTADLHGCLLLDLSMPNMTGMELQQELNERDATIPIIFVTGHGGVPESVLALKRGAIDFIEKPFKQEDLLRGIDEAFRKHARLQAALEQQRSIKKRFDSLTSRESDVLKLMVSGSANLSNKEIAKVLGISHRTVDNHRARVMEKSGARSIAELARMADAAGILSTNVLVE